MDYMPPLDWEGLPDANLPACHVGVVFALGVEAGAIEDRLKGVITIRGGKFAARQGGFKGKGIVVVHGGIGQRNAASATELLIAGHRPRWVISAGFAGGLRDDVKVGDIVMPDFVVAEDGRRLAVDLHITSEQISSTPGLHVGPLVTVDRPALKPTVKRELGVTHGAIAVDMETMAVAEICRRHEQRFLAVRVVTDTADQELPADVGRLLSKKTTARRIGAAAGSLLRRPSAAKDLWRLRETALVCSKRLANFLEGVIEQLGD
jgi:adenosylhomocysteine nucleosidase